MQDRLTRMLKLKENLNNFVLLLNFFFLLLFEETRFSKYYIVNKYYPGHAISFLTFSYHKEENPSLS